MLAFEDRHDASHCMAVLKQWPEYDWCEMQVQMMPTKQLEETLQEAFDAQVGSKDGAGGTSGRAGGIGGREGWLKEGCFDGHSGADGAHKAVGADAAGGV